MNREERRAAMPQVTAWVDDIRSVFGEPNAIKASENGLRIEWQKKQITRHSSWTHNICVSGVSKNARVAVEIP